MVRQETSADKVTKCAHRPDDGSEGHPNRIREKENSKNDIGKKQKKKKKKNNEEGRGMQFMAGED